MLKIYGSFQNFFSESRAISCKGNGKIKRQISAFNCAAEYGYYFVITDLDNNTCAPSLIREWLPVKPHNQLLFRVAVHEVESWLLADRENFASFFSISQNLIPLNPDNEVDPKRTVISLAKKSRKKEIREAIIPVDDHAINGPGYNIQFQSFIQNMWNIDSARKNSPSLDKTIKVFEKIAYPGISYNLL